MKISSILVFNGHGSSQSINLGGGATVDFGNITDNIFPKTELVIYSSCLCGSGGETNMNNFINQTLSRGVETDK
jgi:hypothetical protein